MDSILLQLFLYTNSKSLVAAGSATNNNAPSTQFLRENGVFCRSKALALEKSRIPSMMLNVSIDELLIVSTYSLCCSVRSVSIRKVEQLRSALNGVRIS
jgi:hypothetical protein